MHEGLTQIVVEIREIDGIRNHAVQIAQVEPLSREIGDQRFGFRVRKHAASLPFEHEGITQLALACDAQKLVVGNAAPQKEGKARGQIEIADAMSRRRTGSIRVALGADKKFRACEEALESQLNAGVETLRLVAGAVEGKQLREVAGRVRPAIGSVDQRGKDLGGARLFAGCVGRAADENPAAARSIAGTCGAERSGDSDSIYVGMAAGIESVIGAAYERLQTERVLGRALFQKGDCNLVWTRG